MNSNVSTQVDIPLRRPPQPVDIEVVRRQPTLTAAIKLCISLGGFDADKQVYMALNIDAGHWSRIMRGEAHFPTNKLDELMDLCGNESPLIWLTDRRGYELKPKLSETERRLEAERAARLEAERKLEYFEHLVRNLNAGPRS